MTPSPSSRVCEQRVNTCAGRKGQDPRRIWAFRAADELSGRHPDHEACASRSSSKDHTRLRGQPRALAEPQSNKCTERILGLKLTLLALAGREYTPRPRSSFAVATCAIHLDQTTTRPPSRRRSQSPGGRAQGGSRGGRSPRAKRTPGDAREPIQAVHTQATVAQNRTPLGTS